MTNTKHLRLLVPTLLSLVMVFGLFIMMPGEASADTCGDVKTSIDFGCRGGDSNGIYDILFAIIRFLTVGVGLVLVLMTIINGIVYTMSEGDPAKTKAVKLRLFGIGVALVIYLLGMTILNYLVPGGVLG